MKMMISCMIFIIILLNLFFYLSKSHWWESLLASSFECGFTSYFYSRFTFSIHYFIVGLIFLFLDLELCFVMPFLNEALNSMKIQNMMMIFVSILLMGLIEEWKESKLDWVY